MVRLGPGDDVRARLVGADPKSDLAVLQIKADLKVQAEWGDSDKLDIGDWVLAIGSPLALRPFRDRGHRLGDRAKRGWIRRVRVVHSDRCGDQPWQLGGAARQSGRQGRGNQYGHHHPIGRIRGDRPGHPLVAGAAGGRELDQERQGRSRLSGSHALHRSARHDDRPGSSSFPTTAVP